MSRHGSTRSNLSSVSSATSYQSFQWQCSADPVEVIVEDMVKYRLQVWFCCAQVLQNIPTILPVLRKNSFMLILTSVFALFAATVLLSVLLLIFSIWL